MGNTVPTLEEVHDLYRAAITADDAYDAAIKAHGGARATRWTIGEAASRHPAIVAAYTAKRETFDAWEAASRARDAAKGDR